MCFYGSLLQHAHKHFLKKNLHYFVNCAKGHEGCDVMALCPIVPIQGCILQRTQSLSREKGNETSSCSTELKPSSYI